MKDNTQNLNLVPQNNGAYSDDFVALDTVFRISEEFERDSRRYNRAFFEEQEVSTR